MDITFQTLSCEWLERLRETSHHKIAGTCDSRDFVAQAHKNADKNYAVTINKHHTGFSNASGQHRAPLAHYHRLYFMSTTSYFRRRKRLGRRCWVQAAATVAVKAWSASGCALRAAAAATALGEDQAAASITLGSISWHSRKVAARAAGACELQARKPRAA